MSRSSVMVYYLIIAKSIAWLPEMLLSFVYMSYRRWTFMLVKNKISVLFCSISLLSLIAMRSLRKHAYSNILKFSPQKIWKISNKNSDIFHISAQNIDCGYSLEPPRRGGSNEYPQSMFLSRSKKNNVYPCKPQFYYITVGIKGVKLYTRYVFVM